MSWLPFYHDMGIVGLVLVPAATLIAPSVGTTGVVQPGGKGIVKNDHVEHPFASPPLL